MSGETEIVLVNRFPAQKHLTKALQTHRVTAELCSSQEGLKFVLQWIDLRNFLKLCIQTLMKVVVVFVPLGSVSCGCELGEIGTLLSL